MGALVEPILPRNSLGVRGNHSGGWDVEHQYFLWDMGSLSVKGDEMKILGDMKKTGSAYEGYASDLGVLGHWHIEAPWLLDLIWLVVGPPL